ncbi:hypothetical protein G7Y89_g14271 [Cudoniella acicularis]|uniref:Tubulin-specific chaperone D C-terminal domain-containing protein n=1 Tax=Cudoniella acicularis TaxID=354080 RepID=A0A8H4VU80_9HELO|nr:hypothetical protein G7Y89_g14271 [Cudoniella acicularis]
MDASEVDRDVLLQKSSAELLADLENSLHPFLWKTPALGMPRIRRRLERFQELPQLLDPHLNDLVPVLAQAFLSYLQSVPRPKHSTSDTELLITLSKAICRLLYTFCKVRGEKVIVRFLSTETRHLELLLSAIENGNPAEGQAATSNTWSWEERYITLLWLSQLLLAPFDLASISSSESEDENIPIIPHLSWPNNVPGISLRVIPLAIRCLSSPGKERDAARFLLVRIAMRRDMQDLGMLKALVRWAVASFNPSSDVEKPVYHYIGLLSFLAGILNSSIGTSDMAQHVPQIFQLIENISETENIMFHAIRESAVARKIIIKIIRTISVLDLRTKDMTRTESTIDTLLGYLSHPSTPVRLAASKSLSMITMKLDKINPEFATQIIEAVLDELERGITWLKVSGTNETSFDLTRADPSLWHGLILTLAHLLYRHSVGAQQLPSILSYLAVGLAFQRKSTTGGRLGTNVRDAACFGIWALARRYSTSELTWIQIKISSLSGAVQIQPLPSNEISITSPGYPVQAKELPSKLVLQRLATELVISACLDPEGNIRRGASAALQELVGRHPDIIVEGIKLVQVVDYHAVALRSRAIQQVSFEAARLSDNYYDGLRIALLGWRGAMDGDASIRRMAASAYANVVWSTRYSDPVEKIPHMFDYSTLNGVIHSLSIKLGDLGNRPRDVDEAHGIFLSISCLARKLTMDPNMLVVKRETESAPTDLTRLILRATQLTTTAMAFVERSFESSTSRQELLAESSSRLLFAIYPCVFREALRRFLQSNYGSSLSSIEPSTIEHASSLPTFDELQSLEQNIVGVLDSLPSTKSTKVSDALSFMKTLQKVYDVGSKSGVAFRMNVPLNSPGLEYPMLFTSAKPLLTRFLETNDDISIDAVSDAAAGLVLLQPKEERSSILLEWIQVTRGKAEAGRKGQGKAYIHTLFKALQILEDHSSNSGGLEAKIIKALNWRWDLNYDIEIRTTLLRCLGNSSAIITHTKEFGNMIFNGLEDYTTDSRGDIGSLVRIEATKIVGILFKKLDPSVASNTDLFRNLIGKVLRLGTEKLDKVRIEAQLSILQALTPSQSDIFTSMSPTSQMYFHFLLRIPKQYGTKNPPCDQDWILDLFEGYVLSADTGSQDLIRVSRAALVQFCEDEAGNIDIVCHALCKVLERNLSNDRVLVSTLEVISFLFDVQIMQKSTLKWSSLYFLIQKAHFKSSNVRKLEAAVRVYSGLLEVYPEPLKKLKSMLRHNFPKVRNLAEEELFVVTGEKQAVKV